MSLLTMSLTSIMKIVIAVTHLNANSQNPRSYNVNIISALGNKPTQINKYYLMVARYPIFSIFAIILTSTHSSNCQTNKCASKTAAILEDTF